MRGLLVTLALSAGLLLANASAQAHPPTRRVIDAPVATYDLPALTRFEAAPLPVHLAAVKLCPAEGYALPAVRPLSYSCLGARGGHRPPHAFDQGGPGYGRPS